MSHPRKSTHPIAVDGDQISPATGSALQTRDGLLLSQESFRAIMSSHKRAGHWEPAEEIRVRAIMGEVTLDFTHAEFPPSGMIEIYALAFCGEVNIIVPDGAEVEIGGTPFMGSIEHKARKRGVRERGRELVTGERDEDLPAPRPPQEPPYFCIDCRAIMGSIKVTGG